MTRATKPTTARRIGVINAETSFLVVTISDGRPDTPAIEIDLGDSAPSTVYATAKHEILIVEGEDDLPGQLTRPAPTKQLRHHGTFDASGKIVLGAYRSVDLRVPRGVYDVFIDYTPVEVADGVRSYVVARLAPAGTLVATRAATKKPLKKAAAKVPARSSSPDLPALIGNRKPATVVTLDLHHQNLHALPDLAALEVRQAPQRWWKLLDRVAREVESLQLRQSSSICVSCQSSRFRR